MPKYNLITGGFIQSSTTSGIGNKILSSDQLRALYDADFITNAVTLLSSDILCLEIDLINRVKISDIELYIDVVGDRNVALTKVDFYYKNDEIDLYTLCVKAQDADKFYVVDSPELFAPRFFRIILSNLECTLFELKLSNDDTEVSFGTDGSDTIATIDNGLFGYDTIDIFNNSEVGTKAVNAYIIVDYEKESDYYIKLSNTSDGDYIDLSSGGLLTSAGITSGYTWSRGNLNNTYIRDSSVIINPTLSGISIGTYTTPVIHLGDPLMSSFLVTEKTVLSGTTLTNSENLSADSVLIRSSNIAPLPFTKFFITDTRSDGSVHIYEGDLSTGSSVSTKAFDLAGYASNPFNVLFYKNKSYFYVTTNRDLRIYKYNNVEERLVTSITESTSNDFSNSCGLDGLGNLWVHSITGGYKLRVFDANTLVSQTIVDGATSFFVALSPSITSNTCWYTNFSTKKVYHVDYSGSVLCNKSLGNPTYVCSIYDGGCWVIDAGTADIIRYDYNGNEIKRVKYNSTYTIINISYNIDTATTTIFHERFWIVTSTGLVTQYDFNGNVISNTNIASATYISAFLGGCMVYVSSYKTAYQLNSEGVIVRIWPFTSLANVSSKLTTVTMDYDDFLGHPEAAPLLPITSDPVWGSSHNNGWKEIVDNGSLLPFAKYHQIKYTFTGQCINIPITNPGFENGTTGWNCSSFTTTSTYKYTGANSAGCMTGYAAAWAEQTIDLATGSGLNIELIDNTFLLYVGCWGLRHPGVYAIVTGYLELKLYDDNNNYILNSTYTSEVGTESYWRKLNILINLFPGVRYIKIKAIVPYVAYSSFYLFDDFFAQILRTPTLNRVSIPKPVIINDISPQTSKKLYIKTDFPVGAPQQDYETKLKCWWGNEEV